MPVPNPHRYTEIWRLRDASVSLRRPAVLGILNVTPDSFSDGGRHLDPAAAAARAFRLVEEGADLLDIGAESTRPGAEPVSTEEEWARLDPVLEHVGDVGVPISVDTTSSEVANRAIAAGARAINDVSGLRADPELADVVAERGAGIILMHMRGTPRTMQSLTSYEDLMGDLRSDLAAAVDRAINRGCAPEQIVVDPGFGFAKTAAASLEILGRLDELLELGRPVLVGPSRKSFVGSTLDLPVEERLEGTIAACAVALVRGARLFRVHDVRPVRRALDLAQAVLDATVAEEGPVPAAAVEAGRAGAVG